MHRTRATPASGPHSLQIHRPMHPTTRSITFVAVLWAAIFSWSKLQSDSGNKETTTIPHESSQTLTADPDSLESGTDSEEVHL